MLQVKQNKSAFTLIELLVVVIIVAVLAAVGIPLLRGNIERARMSEADAGLGAIRTAMRAEFAENNNYNTNVAVGAIVGQNVGLNANDLTGRYFEDDDYVIQAVAATTFCARVTGDTAGLAPRGNEVNTLSRSMDQDGDIFASADCSGATIN